MRFRWTITGRALGVAIAVFLPGCDPPELEPPAPAADSLRTTQQSTNIRVVETGLGRRKWLLEAGQATSNETTGVSVLRSVRVTFYDEDGSVASTLTSEEGEAESKTRHLVARKNVIVETPDGERLETEILEWDNARKKILTDAPVRIVQGENVYTGVGLVSDPDLEHFEILKDVRGAVRSDDGSVDEWRLGRP
jgi:LPS export ABC transporter protein LptC